MHADVSREENEPPVLDLRALDLEVTPNARLTRLSGEPNEPPISGLAVHGGVQSTPPIRWRL